MSGWVSPLNSFIFAHRCQIFMTHTGNRMLVGDSHKHSPSAHYGTYILPDITAIGQTHTNTHTNMHFNNVLKQTSQTMLFPLFLFLLFWCIFFNLDVLARPHFTLLIRHMAQSTALSHHSLIPDNCWGRIIDRRSRQWFIVRRLSFVSSNRRRRQVKEGTEEADDWPWVLFPLRSQERVSAQEEKEVDERFSVSFVAVPRNSDSKDENCSFGFVCCRFLWKDGAVSPWGGERLRQKALLSLLCCLNCWTLVVIFSILFI